jgi:hypothetical protein
MWYNPAVFASPANGSFGDFHRNSIYGPGIDNWNMSLFKNFNFTENTRIQLRFEAYNVFNHTQWGTINNGLSAPTPEPRSLALTRVPLARSPLHVIPVSCSSGVSSTSTTFGLRKAGLKPT